MTRDQLLQQIGKKVTYYRKLAGLSQTELALRLDKDRQNVNRIEKGGINISVSALAEVAKELDIPLKALFDFE